MTRILKGHKKIQSFIIEIFLFFRTLINDSVPVRKLPRSIVNFLAICYIYYMSVAALIQRKSDHIPDHLEDWIITSQPYDDPALTVNDLAAVRGDGIFETLLTQSGKVIKPEAHLKRMKQSAASLALSIPPDDIVLEALEGLAKQFFVESPQTPEGFIRIATSRGRESDPHSHCFLMASPISAKVPEWRSYGISMITLNRGYDREFARNSPWSLLGAKTLSYATNMAAGRFAQSQGAEDAIYITNDGWVLEGTRGAIVWRNGNTLFTTPLEDGILTSTTQLELFSAAEKHGLATQYLPTTKDKLYEAEAVWMISSLTLATWVNTIDNRPTQKPSEAHTKELWELLTAGLQLGPTTFAS